LTREPRIRGVHDGVDIVMIVAGCGAAGHAATRERLGSGVLAAPAVGGVALATNCPADTLASPDRGA